MVYLRMDGHYLVDCGYVVYQTYSSEDASVGLLGLWAGFSSTVSERLVTASPKPRALRNDGRFCHSAADLSGFICGKKLIL